MTLKARSGSHGLKANKRTKALAQVAKSNGSVDARIRSTDGKTRAVSSRSRPLKLPYRYEAKSMLPSEAFEQAAQELAVVLR